MGEAGPVVTGTVFRRETDVCDTSIMHDDSGIRFGFKLSRQKGGGEEETAMNAVPWTPQHANRAAQLIKLAR